LQVGGLPFAVSDPVKAREGGLRVLAQIPEALAEFTKFGHVLVAMTATADYHVVTHDPIRNLADLKGKKVGTFGRIAPKVLQAGGAIPVSTTGGEMYEALQRKTIDARINSYEGTKRFKLYEVAKYISTISMGAIAGVNMFTINKRKWDSLSKEHQKILLEEGERVGKWEAQAMRDGDAEFQKYLQGKGMQIVEFSAEDREKWNSRARRSAPSAASRPRSSRQEEVFRSAPRAERCTRPSSARPSTSGSSPMRPTCGSKPTRWPST
jgi:TRAP-type C4-dicarboxylate transport system substrate-binding protein